MENASSTKAPRQTQRNGESLYGKYFPLEENIFSGRVEAEAKLWQAKEYVGCEGCVFHVLTTLHDILPEWISEIR